MRNRTIPIVVVLLLLVAGCSSSDPTASDEYEALVQELAQSEAQVAEMTAERDALAEEVQSALAALGDGMTIAVPDDVAALTDAWGDAMGNRDGSVTALYTEDGFHLYNTTKIEHDDIAAHLEAPTTDGRWATEPFLLIEQGYGDRYIVARGVYGAGVHPGSMTFLIVRDEDRELKIAETAFVYGG